uniref:Thioredoxin domain-containing protein n=1 Tax=Cryptomonas curvata TaxID=233186 RepID=A0A7S0MRH5_9CRYP|mmetsp:Transcript_52395/g.109313  ORF Transcript_52395/g.109313 Transcript_52395/m.109313 type:complete len:144 (+) Transcript_52395:78-509(+)
MMGKAFSGMSTKDLFSLCLLVYIFESSAQSFDINEPKDSQVKSVHRQDFQDFINKNSLVQMEFYAPWSEPVWPVGLRNTAKPQPLWLLRFSLVLLCWPSTTTAPKSSVNFERETFTISILIPRFLFLTKENTIDTLEVLNPTI